MRFGSPAWRRERAGSGRGLDWGRGRLRGVFAENCRPILYEKVIMEERKIIRELTELFRTSTEPFWIQLRAVMRERGIDPDTSLLADSFEDDINFEFGVLVTRDRQVIQYGFQYSDASFSDGKLTEWNDLAELWSSSPYRSEVSTALSMLDEDAMNFGLSHQN